MSANNWPYEEDDAMSTAETETSQCSIKDASSSSTDEHTIISIVYQFVAKRQQKELNKCQKEICDVVDLLRCFGAYSLKQIYAMSNSQLWRMECAYGMKLQKFICERMNWSAPFVKRRQREKKPLKNGIHRKQPNKSEERRPSSPRDQVAVHEFCLDLLRHPYYKDRIICWHDRKQRILRLKDPKKVAYLWMKVKDNDICSADHFGRAVRFSRNKSGYFEKMIPQKKRCCQLSQKALNDFLKKRKEDID